MVEVRQEDRERAASFLESWEPGPEMTVVKLARAFAAHAADTRAKVIALVESGMYSEYGRPQPELVKAIRELGEQP